MKPRSTPVERAYTLARIARDGDAPITVSTRLLAALSADASGADYGRLRDHLDHQTTRDVDACALEALIKAAELRIAAHTHGPDARTYTSRAETRPGVIRHMLPGDDEITFVIHADPKHTPLPNGGRRTSIGFPILIVTGWVANAEAIAAKIATVLTEAGL